MRCRHNFIFFQVTIAYICCFVISESSLSYISLQHSRLCHDQREVFKTAWAYGEIGLPDYAAAGAGRTEYLNQVYICR